MQAAAQRRAAEEKAKRAELARLLGDSKDTRMRLMKTLDLLDSEDEANADLSEDTKALLEERADELTETLREANRTRLAESESDRYVRCSEIARLRSSLGMSNAEIRDQVNGPLPLKGCGVGTHATVSVFCAQCNEVLLSWQACPLVLMGSNRGDVCDVCDSIHWPLGSLVRSPLD